MRGGGQGDEDAFALGQEAATFYNEELCPLAVRMEALVVDTVQDKCRQDTQGSNQNSNVGRLKVRQIVVITTDCVNIMNPKYFKTLK